MDGGVGPNAGGAADTAAHTPLHDSDFSPVGSPDAALHDVHGFPSDEDHDHDHEEDADADADADHNQDQDQPPGPDHTEVLKNKIIKQVEYYFSDENLPTDKHMIGLIKKNKQGFGKLLWAHLKCKALKAQGPAPRGGSG